MIVPDYVVADLSDIITMISGSTSLITARSLRDEISDTGITGQWLNNYGRNRTRALSQAIRMTGKLAPYSLSRHGAITVWRVV